MPLFFSCGNWPMHLPLLFAPDQSSAEYIIQRVKLEHP
jgi:hypothetical protein